MNVHDSERIGGLLEEAGYVPVAADAAPDLVVFNTCAVRENADNKLYGNLSHLAPAKRANPDMQIAVGGCLAQKDRGEIVKRAPWVDAVFWDPQHRLAAGAPGARPPQPGGRGRDPRIPRDLPFRSAHQA